MNPELKQLLVIAAISIPVGLIIGFILRKTIPNLCKTYIKSCYDRKWWVFAIFLAVFVGWSLISYIGGAALFWIYVRWLCNYARICPDKVWIPPDFTRAGG